MVNKILKDVIDVFHIVLVVAFVFVVGFFYYDFTFKHTICDVDSITLIGNFTTTNISFFDLKECCSSNITGLMNQNVFFDSNFHVYNCSFKLVVK